MKVDKTFDCVKMKDAIHAKLAAEYRGLTDEQILRRVRHKLATSDNPVARLWRSLEPKGRGKPTSPKKPRHNRVGSKTA